VAQPGSTRAFCQVWKWELRRLPKGMHPKWFYLLDGNRQNVKKWWKLVQVKLNHYYSIPIYILCERRTEFSGPNFADGVPFNYHNSSTKSPILISFILFFS
jgi:hypothetical protein